MEKYIVNFDRKGYLNACDKLNAQVNDLNKLEEVKNRLTKALKTKIDSLDKLEKHLKQKTGFANLLLAADALGVKEEYEQYISLNSIMSFDKKLVVKEDGKYVLKEAHLEDLKASYTTYIPKELKEEYDALYSLVELINGLETNKRNALVRNSYGEYYINKHQFISNL